MSVEWTIIRADLDTPTHQSAVLRMMDAYAADPMGDGKPLSDDARSNLIPGLQKHPTTLIFLAFDETSPVAIAVCFFGFSTFAAKPLIHLSDFYVEASHRSRGIGRELLKAVETAARQSGCCKLTLEVQENNERAQLVYGSFGFQRAVYVADAGGSLAMSKPLK